MDESDLIPIFNLKKGYIGIPDVFVPHERFSDLEFQYYCSKITIDLSP